MFQGYGNLQMSAHYQKCIPQRELINDLRTDCDMTKYVDDAIMWEVCEYTGVDSDIQVAADQTTTWTDQTTSSQTQIKPRKL